MIKAGVKLSRHNLLRKHNGPLISPEIENIISGLKLYCISRVDCGESEWALSILFCILVNKIMLLTSIEIFLNSSKSFKGCE